MNITVPFRKAIVKPEVLTYIAMTGIPCESATKELNDEWFEFSVDVNEMYMFDVAHRLEPYCE